MKKRKCEIMYKGELIEIGKAMLERGKIQGKEHLGTECWLFSPFLGAEGRG
jgi:hypothetical protein